MKKDDQTRALAAGIGAITCWSLMVGFLRLTTDAYGPEIGIALIYTLGALLLFVLDRPTPIPQVPRTYLVVGGGMFAVYELCMSFAIGLAANSSQAIEVSILNYLWPTFLVLLWALIRRDGRVRAFLRVLPGALLATAGIVLAVGGESVLTGAPLFAGDALPYFLAIGGACVWALYSVVAPFWSKGANATAYFFAIVAAVLWIGVLVSRPDLPVKAFDLASVVPLLCVTLAIASGYALWNHAITSGDMRRLSVVSYFAPVLSSLAGSIILGVMPPALFWIGATLVALGSIAGWYFTRSPRAGKKLRLLDERGTINRSEEDG